MKLQHYLLLHMYCVTKSFFFSTRPDSVCKWAVLEASQGCALNECAVPLPAASACTGSEVRGCRERRQVCAEESCVLLQPNVP